MTLIDFYTLYEELLIEESKSTDFKDIYCDNKEYTKKICDLMTHQISEKFNSMEEGVVKDYTEFFKIDHTFWKEKKVDPVCGTKVYNWDQIAVFEHENDSSDWTYEVAKLDYIKAPLKVVIGFRKNNIDSDIEILKSQARYLKHISTDEEFGVILMNSTYAEEPDPFNMKCYRIISTEKVETVNKLIDK